MSMVYCIRCHRLVEEKQAIDIMKTGFYKNDIPVANRCVNCHVNKNGGEQASTLSKEIP